MPLSTFRPCYVTIVPREIRGRLRVFLHITVEGDFLEKKRERSREDIASIMKVMAEDKVYFRKMRVRILRKMAAIKRVDAPKEAVAWRLSELSSRYKDNKRYLRDIAKGEEILMKQMTSTMGV